MPWRSSPFKGSGKYLSKMISAFAFLFLMNEIKIDCDQCAFAIIIDHYRHYHYHNGASTFRESSQNCIDKEQFFEEPNSILTSCCLIAVQSEASLRSFSPHLDIRKVLKFDDCIDPPSLKTLLMLNCDLLHRITRSHT